MTTHVATRELRVDAQGMVEISGLTHGEDEAKRLAHELGLGAYEPLNILSTIIRSGPYDATALAAIKAKAAGHAMRLVEVASLEELHPKRPSLAAGKTGDLPATSTMAVLHEHSLGPTGKQKLYLPLIFLGALAVLVLIIAVIRDHATKGYARVDTLAEVVAMADRPAAGGNALASFFNPDDSRFAAVEVTTWPFWLAKTAVVEHYYLRIPGLKEPSIEEMVKGDKGAQPVLFKIDASRRNGTVYRIDAVERGGLPTPNRDIEMEIIPLVLGTEPAMSLEGGEGVYRDASGVRPDQAKDVEGLGTFAVQAFVVKTEAGYRLRAERFSMAVGGDLTPGVRAILNDLAVANEAVDTLIEGKVTPQQRIDISRRRATWYLRVGQLHPAVQRAASGEIGSVAIDGVSLRKVHVRNVSG